MEKEGKKKITRLSWREFGSGDAVAVFFHGYGESTSSNEAFVGQLAKHQRVIAIDLPYHGEQELQDGKAFIESVAQLLDSLHMETYSILAYSLGAHYAFGLLQFSPNQTQSVHLIAPDGLVPNNPQRWMLHTKPGNWMFKHFILKPGIYQNALKVVARLGILNRKAADFYLKSVERRTNRFLLFVRWIAAHSLIANYTEFYHWLNTHQPNIHLYMGKYDKVIPLKKARKFKAKVPHVKIHEFDLGHRMLRKEVADGVKAHF